MLAEADQAWLSSLYSQLGSVGMAPAADPAATAWRYLHAIDITTLLVVEPVAWMA